jgi:hypothetical protein
VTTPTCPSGRCRDGAVLLGVVGPEGAVGFVSPPMVVDDEFVRRARAADRPPEARFRFAEPCVEDACGHWTGDRCGVVDGVLGSRAGAATAEARVGLLPRCGIRRSCRWFAQRGAEACAVCPLVVHTRRVPAGGSDTEGEHRGRSTATPGPPGDTARR